MKFHLNYCYKYKDLYNLYNKIKKINSNYELYYNSKDKMFIIVNIAKNNEICLTFYNFNLDIEKILKFTNIKNFSQIFNYLNTNNENLRQNKINAFKEKTLTAYNECNNLIKKTSSISQNDINKIIGESNA